MGGAVTITPDQAPASGSVTITPDAGQEKGLLDRLADDDADIPLTSHAAATAQGFGQIGRGVFQAVRAARDTFNPKPQPGENAITSTPIGRIVRGLFSSAKQATEVPSAIHDINQSPDPASTYLKVAGDTAGQGAGQLIPAVVTDRVAADPAAAAQTAGRIAKTGGKVARGVVEDIPVVRQAGRLKKYWDETAPKPEPEPAPATKPATPARGSVAQSMQPPTPDVQPIQRGSLSKMLQEQLEKGLGASPPLDPKTPLRGQISSVMKESTDVPQGHTPVQSSAMRSKMYDPGAKEFHARLTSGDTTYVYGDVSPEEADAFEQSTSKGQAFHQIKSNHPLVAKIVNGKRVAVKPSGAK